MDWESKFNMTCKNYVIKKKNISKFIDAINNTDSLKITNFDRTWVESFSEKPIRKNEFEIVLPDEQICTLMRNKHDSVPIQICFYPDQNKIITMTLCVDSNTSLKIFQIIKAGQLAKPNR